MTALLAQEDNENHRMISDDHGFDHDCDCDYEAREERCGGRGAREAAMRWQLIAVS